MEVLVELDLERPAVLGVLELGRDLLRIVVLEQLGERRAGLGHVAQLPHAAAGVDGAGVEPLQRLVGLGRVVGLHHLGVQVAERARRQQHEVDVAVDPPHVPHVVGHLVELGEQLLVGHPGVVGLLLGVVLGDQLRLPLLLPPLADARHLGGQLVVVPGHPIGDLGLVGERVEADVEEVVDVLVRHHHRAVVLVLRLGEPLRQRLDDQVERQRVHGPRRVHLVEVPEARELVRSRKCHLVGRDRHCRIPLEL